jgi:hypothetical protein
MGQDRRHERLFNFDVDFPIRIPTIMLAPSAMREHGNNHPAALTGNAAGSGK